MQIDQNLVFRKAVVPWYDSDTACVIIAVCMFVVFLFAVIGIHMARQISQYQEYQWVPILLAGLSVTVLVSTLIRLMIRRSAER
jgi:hypothetical protein